jgi:hypothetical protein
MRYRWDDGIVHAGGTEVATTDAHFWGRSPHVRVGGADWMFRIEREGLVGALDGVDRLALERGRIWHSSWRFDSLHGPLRLTRTTSWLIGKLYFDLDRDGERVAEIAPYGPWRYRPSLELEVEGALEHAEAVFLVWAAFRIDARRPQSRIQGGPTATGGSSGVTVG